MQEPGDAVGHWVLAVLSADATLPGWVGGFAFESVYDLSECGFDPASIGVLTRNLVTCAGIRCDEDLENLLALIELETIRHDIAIQDVFVVCVGLRELGVEIPEDEDMRVWEGAGGIVLLHWRVLIELRSWESRMGPA